MNPGAVVSRRGQLLLHGPWPWETEANYIHWITPSAVHLAGPLELELDGP